MARQFMFAALCQRAHPLKHSLAESTFVSRVQKTAKKIFVNRHIRQRGHSLAEVSLYFISSVREKIKIVYKLYTKNVQFKLQAYVQLLPKAIYLVLISPQPDQEGNKLGTCAISTTSRRELSSVSFFLHGNAPKEIHATLTEALADFLPGRAKDLAAPLYLTEGHGLNKEKHYRAAAPATQCRQQLDCQ